MKIKEYNINPNIWKEYPVCISGQKMSICCKEPTVLVQSMEGGFVTRNCWKCGRSETLPEKVFYSLNLLVACPECKRPMRPTKEDLDGWNYGYVCDKCEIGIKLANLLPHYEDI